MASLGDAATVDLCNATDVIHSMCNIYGTTASVRVVKSRLFYYLFLHYFYRSKLIALSQVTYV